MAIFESPRRLAREFDGNPGPVLATNGSPASETKLRLHAPSRASLAISVRRRHLGHAATTTRHDARYSAIYRVSFDASRPSLRVRLRGSRAYGMRDLAPPNGRRRDDVSPALSPVRLVRARPFR